MSFKDEYEALFEENKDLKDKVELLTQQLNANDHLLKKLQEGYELHRDRFAKLMEMVGSCSRAFSIELNMNDTFGWACADSGSLSVFDVKKVFEVYLKHGHVTLIAYEVLNRDGKEEPAHGMAKDPSYLAAKAELEKLAHDGTILFEKFYDRQKAKE